MDIIVFDFTDVILLTFLRPLLMLAHFGHPHFLDICELGVYQNSPCSGQIIQTFSEDLLYLTLL